MNSYPADFLVHNLPLLFVSGLEPENTVDTPAGDTRTFLGDGGFRVRSELPPLHHPLKDDLRATLLSYDRSDAPWRTQPVDKSDQAHSFKIRSVGRAFTFPARKAPPPPHSPRLTPAGGVSPPPLALHSTLSPLSPSSLLYPDGIFTPLWITKHQHRLPSVLVSFYNLISDQNVSSLEDNKIKIDVNNLRSLINSTNYKTRFIIVLVADGLIAQSDLEERLINIRRGTNFDSKGLYFLPSTSSKTEIHEFAKVLLTTSYTTSIEYYRDLSKHARRKRNRNVVPQPTIPPAQGTSSVLALQGWNVRYEFKLAVFAEQRQEMEAACRNYETAYEGLFSGELLDSIPGWSARFNEARMLADVIAIRIIRCFLWTSQSTAAVKWWIKHKERIQNLVDRRGKGTETYGWQAWRALWSKIMAELMERSEVFSVAAQRLGISPALPVQLLPEREAAMIDRQAPWEYLHHEGYWLSSFAKHIETRRRYAMQIPPEDRVLDQNNKATTNERTSLYDDYLVPDPAHEYAMLDMAEIGYAKRLCEAIDSSIEAFQRRSQTRMIELLEQRLSGEHIRAKAWSKAMDKLKLVWYESSWRQQGWWSLLSQVGQQLVKTAIEVDDHEMCLRLVWEVAGLHNQQLNAVPKLDAAKVISAAVDLGVCLPQLSPSFAFAADTGRVGEPVSAQLSLTCTTDTLPLGLQVSELKIVFEGGINQILLTGSSSTSEDPDIGAIRMVDVSLSDHTNSSTSEDPDVGAIRMVDVSLSDLDTSTINGSKRTSLSGPAVSLGQADLSFAGKGTRVFNIDIVPREAGPVSVSSIVVVLTNGSQEVALTAREPEPVEAIWWETRGGAPVPRMFGSSRSVASINILPKPPKVEIRIPNLAKAYYTNESVRIKLDIANEEIEAVQGSFEARIISPARGNVEGRWEHDETSVHLNDGEIKEAILPMIVLDGLEPGATKTYSLLMSGLDESIDHEIELKVSYTLPSDPANPLMKQMTIDIPIVRPFEATTIFQPRHHAEQWPDFFAVPEDSKMNQAIGLKQSYLARTSVGCFAQETLLIRSLELRARRIVGGALFSASVGRVLTSVPTDDQSIAEKGAQIQSEKTQQFVFDVELQKLILGDRSPVTLDCFVEIHWSRTESETINTSILPLAKFLAPMSEPRVLLRTTGTSDQLDTCLLTYTIENPSMHFLTFNITMTGGEDVAFSGPKMKTISLVPVSRYDLRYRIFTQKKKEWVKVQLDVLDAVFQQHLKIQPVSDNVRVDKQGVVQLTVEE